MNSLFVHNLICNWVPYCSSHDEILLRIAERAAFSNGFTVEELKGRSRKRELTDVRHYAMYRMAMDNKHISLATIGLYMNRDHSSIVHARNRISYLLDFGDRKISAIHKNYWTS